MAVGSKPVSGKGGARRLRVVTSVQGGPAEAPAHRVVVRRGGTKAAGRPAPPEVRRVLMGAEVLSIRSPGQAAAPGRLRVIEHVESARLAGAGSMASDQDRVNAGRYRLNEMLAEGGSGRVYRAQDLLLDTTVVIKALRSELLQDAAARQSLCSESRAAMQLAHPHVVRLFDLHNTGDDFFLVMEFVNGRSLREILREAGRLPPETVAQIIGVCADAVSHAHRHGVLHNDLKPDNLLLDDEGVLKIIDFGIATLKRARRDSEYVEGTPVYMSPEQIRGETLDGRSDEYALAVTACELLTGAPPYAADEDLDKQLACRERIRLSGIAPEVAEVLERAMHPDRAQRWPSVESFAEALTRALAPGDADAE